MLITVLVGLLILLFAGIPVATALFGLAVLLDGLFAALPLYRAIGTRAWATSSDILLVTVPLFILLGEILLRSGIATRMYTAMASWLSWLPGGLMHANVGACMAFAATAGSSVATSATVSTVAVPMIDKFRYDERLFLGTLAAGGTLGILIPPSINLIVYGYLTDTSVPKLYLAGFLPGILLGFLFMATVLVLCIVKPSRGGERIRSSWAERMRTLPDMVPPLLIFLLVVGSIYLGWATPTESASLGVVGAIAFAAYNGTFSMAMMREAILGTMRTTGMIMLILVAAWFLNFVLSTIGVNQTLNALVSTQGLSPFWTLLLVIGFYVVLGTVMEPMPMMVITVPTLTPIMTTLGYDPVWFGILVVLLSETALISPPVGANLFVVQGIRNRGSMNDVFAGVTPFCFTLIFMIALIIAFPRIVTWLPSTQ
jgi:tripartite ATP-independent transporter DctM subunit